MPDAITVGIPALLMVKGVFMIHNMAHIPSTTSKYRYTEKFIAVQYWVSTLPDGQLSPHKNMLITMPAISVFWLTCFCCM